jgi:hypothetical protein
MALQNHDTALCTRDEFKARMNISDGVKDTQIDDLIIAVSARVSQWCGRKFAQATYTDEIYDGTGTDTLYLRNWPVTTPMSGVSGTIHEDSSRGWTASTLLTEYTSDGNSTTGDYVILPDEMGLGRVKKVTGTWIVGPAVIKVTYQGGYATIPEPVNRAALRLMSQMWTVAERHWDAQTSEAIQAGGGSSTMVEHKMPPDVVELLRPWKRVRFF